MPPRFPNEILALIVEQVGIEHEQRNVTLLSLLNTSSAFAQVTRRELYRHAEFRNKTDNQVYTFLEHISPRHGHYILSVSHCLKVDRDTDEDLFEFFSESRDRLFDRVFRGLDNVQSLKLMVPGETLGGVFAAKTFKAIARWPLRQLTLQAIGWHANDHEDFDYAYDGFFECLGWSLYNKFPLLQSFRMLGHREWPELELPDDTVTSHSPPRVDCRALHICGYTTSTNVNFFVKATPRLTHLVLAACDHEEFHQLWPLLIAVGSTLQSLAIRQTGAIEHGNFFSIPQSTLDPTDFPVLERVVVDHGGAELARTIIVFGGITSLKHLEVGNPNNSNILNLLITTLNVGLTQQSLKRFWPRLETLGYVARDVDAAQWESLHSICDVRKIELLPGHNEEADLPVIFE